MNDEYGFEAEIYDEVWGKYDYDTDVKFLSSLFEKLGCKSIIDIGCGTGNHALRLSRLKYEVTGVDVSAAMLKKARVKDKASKTKFLLGDMRRLAEAIPRGEKFDAAFCLGCVTFHLTTARDLREFLGGVREILKKRGLFVCDVRNSKKISEDHLNRLTLEHTVSKRRFQLLILAYNTRHPRNREIIIWKPIYLMKKNGRVDLELREHRLRWFRFSNWKKMLAKNGFELTTAYSGPHRKGFNEEKHETMWLVAKTN